MIRLSVLMLLAAVLFSACGNSNPPLIPALNPGKLDDNEMLPFIVGTLRTEGTDWVMSEDGMTQILDFNKADYPHAKKIRFATMIRSSSDENHVHAQLYNLTDSIRIPNTDLSSNCECFRWVESGDILSNLPDKPVLLALRIRSEKENFLVSSNYNTFLIVDNR